MMIHRHLNICFHNDTQIHLPCSRHHLNQPNQLNKLVLTRHQHQVLLSHNHHRLRFDFLHIQYNKCHFYHSQCHCRPQNLHHIHQDIVYYRHQHHQADNQPS